MMVRMKSIPHRNLRNNGRESHSDYKEMNVLFVELKSGVSTERQNQMQNAFLCMVWKGFDPKWITESQVMAFDTFENRLLIMDSFEGIIYDYLMSKNARIVGSLTVLYCYSNDCKQVFEDIPNKCYPLFSQCMRNLIVSITNFDAKRKSDLIFKIQRMCGSYHKDLTSKVTHLVSDSVITEKYKFAKRMGINVITSEWVDFCWHKYQYLICPASDQHIIDTYQTPIFKNIVITVSQIDFSERNKIKEMVCNNGGVYSPILKLNQLNTILLLNEPNGQKYKYAKIKNIPCLDVKWIYDSLEKGYSLPHDIYLISLKTQKQLLMRSISQPNLEPTLLLRQSANNCQHLEECNEKSDKCKPKSGEDVSHKSLGDEFNETVRIQWDDESAQPQTPRVIHHYSVENNNLNEISLQIMGNVDENNFEIESKQEVSNEIQIYNNDSADSAKTRKSSTTRVFIFSGFDDQTRLEFSQIVKDLNGIVVDSHQVLETVTHLIVRNPSATEKTLSAIASGIWILKETYLTESKERSFFVNEELFQWGVLLNNDVSVGIVNTSSRKLMVSSIHWRLFMQISGYKLFNGWKVLMMNKTVNTLSYTEILKCGNADVVYLSDMFQSKDLTQYKYVFIDLTQVKEMPKYDIEYANKLIQINRLIKLDFIVYYLVKGLKLLSKSFVLRKFTVRSLE